MPPTGTVGMTGPATSPIYYPSSSVSVSLGSVQTSSTPPKDLGLAIEPIIGWREFQILVGGIDTLLSFNGTAWPHMEPLHAVCGHDPLSEHEVPSEHCACGIYAWNACEGVISGKIFGEVYLWGDVLICPMGYRAESAYPKSLILRSPETRPALRIRDALREAYQIPVTIEPPRSAVEKIEDSLTSTTNTVQTFGNPFPTLTYWSTGTNG